MKKLWILLLLGALLLTSCDTSKNYAEGSTTRRGARNWFGFWGSVGEEAEVQSSRNRLLSYDWYYDMYGQIKAQEANILATDKSASERPGMIKVLNSSIAEYNSKSKQYNHNLWKAPDLPYELDFFKEESK